MPTKKKRRTKRKSRRRVKRKVVRRSVRKPKKKLLKPGRKPSGIAKVIQAGLLISAANLWKNHSFKEFSVRMKRNGVIELIAIEDNEDADCGNDSVD